MPFQSGIYKIFFQGGKMLLKLIKEHAQITVLRGRIAGDTGPTRCQTGASLASLQAYWGEEKDTPHMSMGVGGVLLLSYLHLHPSLCLGRKEFILGFLCKWQGPRAHSSSSAWSQWAGLWAPQERSVKKQQTTKLVFPPLSENLCLLSRSGDL